jgi:DNA-binding transcriptional LysR family regulator
MQLDLNLLTVLDALLEECSVGGAADRLHLSTPAVSRSLGRIRALTGDPILVRTGRTMTPTPRALTMSAEVHEVLGRATAILASEGELDLASLERTFTIQAHDTVLAAIGPGVVRSVRLRARGSTVRFLAETALDGTELRSGTVDIVIGSTASSLAETVGETIGGGEVVGVVSPRSKLATGSVTAEQYAAAEHITVSRRGRLRDPVDDLLEARGLHRHVVASVPTAAAALELVRTSDLVSAVPGDACRTIIDALGLVTFSLPVELRPVAVVMSWHERYRTDRAHEWLRETVRQAWGEQGMMSE